MKSIAVIVPIYRERLNELEFFSLRHSLSQIKSGRAIVFAGPEGLDLSQYSAAFPGIPFIAFEPEYFESVHGYSQLLLRREFYERFQEQEFMLILQTDAILLKDDLDIWCARPYDYVGAPWPDAVEVFVNIGRFGGVMGKKVCAHVGNGGLSLRRITKCISLLAEFPEAVDFFKRTGSSEDIFFGVMGSLSQDFLMPSEIVASTFSLELKPSYYYEVNSHCVPMGGHAWWKYAPEFWLDLLGPQAQGIRSQFPASV